MYDNNTQFLARVPKKNKYFGKNFNKFNGKHRIYGLKKKYV